MKYVCQICGYTYDEEVEKTRFEDLPDDWTCPACGAPKEVFEKEVILGEEKQDNERIDNGSILDDDNLEKLSLGSLSVLFSNLARGSEKQYLFEQQKLFQELSDKIDKLYDLPDAKLNDLYELLKDDIEKKIPNTKEIAAKNSDRGSLRALTWAEKVSKMVFSLLNTLRDKGEDFLNDNDIWVCSVCGFIYIGKEAPKLCPVCKVPDWKFVKM